ncbi:eukaryotic translation initiation factor 3 subunit g-like protein, partial [Lasius niger]
MLTVNQSQSKSRQCSNKSPLNAQSSDKPPVPCRFCGGEHWHKDCPFNDKAVPYLQGDRPQRRILSSSSSTTAAAVGRSNDANESLYEDAEEDFQQPAPEQVAQPAEPEVALPPAP